MFSLSWRPAFWQRCFSLLSIFWMVSAVSLQARSATLFDVEPADGVSEDRTSAGTLTLTATRSKGDRLAQAREWVAQGFRLYEKVDFDGALELFQKAERLTPENAELRKLIEDTRRNRQRQSALYDLLTRQGVPVEDALKKWYQTAQELFGRGEYDEARRGFYQVWLMAGAYGRTLTYLSRIDQIKAGRLHSASEAQGNTDR